MSSNAKNIFYTDLATNMWYNEVKDYDFKSAARLPSNFMEVGHFTALVWKGTTEIGCGVKDGYVACHYCNAPGNMMGRFQ